ncbi:alpha-hemoglobin-stabilizing protein [Ochotona princeps]|uniref:alpha-hemoglobin-stabilizing protein n=1 Tax=Ochotona princeps TaxID=9978 RepID=UPI002714970C|nr:alpha-hemoglobin-stabilizing protein [Ochotona princeps]
MGPSGEKCDPKAKQDLKGQMALLPANKDLICTGKKEFNVLLNQQVLGDPFLSEEAMEIVLDDWVNLYANYYKPQLTGEQQEQDRALQELQRELKELAKPFLHKYRDFLKSQEHQTSSS